MAAPAIRPTGPAAVPIDAGIPALPVTDDDALRRRELGAFLRSRRERIAPEQVGVGHAGRRRTPGLRREEVAQLSGVGVTWYTWLEQGRDIKASDQVLGALARTLMLSGAERAHVFTLAGIAVPELVDEAHAVTAPQRATLAQLDPYPACIQSGKYDVLASNRAYAALFGDFDQHPIEDRNCLWLMFTDPRWRALMVDWDEMAARMVAGLRGLMADHVADASWTALVARLTATSPEFAELWSRRDVRPIENKVKRLRHPVAGELRFDTTNTWLAPRAGSRMLVYVPVDATVAAAVAGLL